MLVVVVENRLAAPAVVRLLSYRRQRPQLQQAHSDSGPT
jgi:hypothetical protein